MRIGSCAVLLVSACGTTPSIGTADVRGGSPTATSGPDVSATTSAALPSPATETPQTPSAAASEVPPPGFVAIPERRPKGFPGTKFTEVRAFAYDFDVRDRPVCGMPLDDDGTLCSTVIRPGVTLSPEQTKQLLAWLAQKSSYGGGSSCFLPHHGFVFYDGETPVAELSLCFMCEMARASPGVPLGGGAEFGMSEKGTAAMRKLCSDLGLPKCDGQSPEDYFGTP